MALLATQFWTAVRLVKVQVVLALVPVATLAVETTVALKSVPEPLAPMAGFF